MSGVDATVAELADKEAIRDLACRYAHCVWQKDIDGAIELFAEDGQMDMGTLPPITGREALREAYRQTVGGGAFRPFVHNHLVELDGDRATGICYLDLRAEADGKSMIGAGFYRDDYVRTAGGWKFQSRKLTLDFFVPLEEGWT